MRSILSFTLLQFATVFIFSSAHAKQVTFYFDILSSGPDIYVCNAGLRHKATTAQYCYYADRPQTTCSPMQHNCVCTSDNGGAYLMDFMRYETKKWTGSKWSNRVYAGSKKASNTANTYNTVVKEADSFDNLMKNLSFNLGSELYGAEFFVDVCFRGSQIEYFKSKMATSNSVRAYATVTDVTNEQPEVTAFSGATKMTAGKYLDLSNLHGKASLVCDLQGRGSYKWAHNGTTYENGEYDTHVNEINYVSLRNGRRSGNDFFRKTPMSKFVVDGTVEMFDSVFINKRNSRHPRFCVVRYEFKEKSNKPRQWQRNDARVKLMTDISEAALD